MALNTVLHTSMRDMDGRSLRGCILAGLENGLCIFLDTRLCVTIYRGLSPSPPKLPDL